MERKTGPDPSAKNKRAWNLSAFITYALAALAVAKRKKKTDGDERPMPDQT
jgi:hypothetical protein